MHNFGRFARIALNTVTLVIVLFVLGTPAWAHVAVSSNSVSFANQAVGTASTPLTITLTNTSRMPTTIISASLSLSVFSVSGLSLPLTLYSGESAVVSVTFIPLAAQAYSDTLLIARAFGSPTFVNLTGNGIASQPAQPPSLLLNFSSSALSFGNVNLSSSASQNVTLTNAGSSDVTISNVSISGPGFTTSGVSSGLTIGAGQTVSLSVTFLPSSSGNVTGSVTLASNASNSPGVITLSGDGVATAAHSVLLSWTPPTSDVVSYNSYSSATSGGPYQKLNASPVTDATYTDTTVNSGSTYYYVVTSVDSNNVESAFSDEVSASVP